MLHTGREHESFKNLSYMGLDGAIQDVPDVRTGKPKRQDTLIGRMILEKTRPSNTFRWKIYQNHQKNLGPKE